MITDRCANLADFHHKINAPINVPLMASGPAFRIVKDIVRDAAKDVIEIHQSLKTGTNPTGSYLAVLRARLMIEELAELLQAMYDQDLVEVADGLADLDYVVTGTGVTYGIPMDDVHQIVHESNMSKSSMDENSKGGKGEGFVPPQRRLAALLGIPQE